MSVAAMGGPAVEASATVRGIIGLTPQTLGAGLKTFKDGLAVADQSGGNAVRITNVSDPIRWGDAVSGPNITALNFIGEWAMWWRGGPVRVDSAQGFVMGGVNSGFSASGINAYSQTYLADVTQGQDVGLAIRAGKTTGVAVKVGVLATLAGTSTIELLRIGHTLGTGTGSDGTAVHSFRADGVFDIAGGSNKEFRMGGNPVLSPANDGGMGILGFRGDGAGGQAALNFGNSAVLTEGNTDLVRFRNGNPFSGAIAARLTPNGNFRIAGALGVGNAVAATGPVGAVVKKIQVYDAAGASLGFVPVYDAIT